jgi:Flp pilus assembly protein TadB
MPSTVVLAADLVPTWFAAGFWVAFAALVVVVVRDVRRAGGIRRVLAALRAAIDQKEAGTSSDPELSEDPRRDGDRR